MAKVRYRFEVESLEGLIKQLAQSLLPNGYWYYVLGQVPKDKSPEEVDRKLIARYELAVSKFTRWRRRQAGEAGVQYLRLGRTFLLLATDGSHEIRASERGNLRDARREPIKIGGYAVSSKDGRASVRIEKETLAVIKAHFVDAALRRSAQSLERAVRNLPFEPYKPVRRQLLGVVRAVNERRKVAGLPLVPLEAVRWRRRTVDVFAGSSEPLSV